MARRGLVAAVRLSDGNASFIGYVETSVMTRVCILAICISAMASAAWSAGYVTSFQVIHRITKAQAEVAEKALSDAPQRILHSAARRADGEIVVVDVWKSWADFERYRNLVEPTFHRLGLPVSFDVIPTMNLVVNGQMMLSDGPGAAEAR